MQGEREMVGGGAKKTKTQQRGNGESARRFVAVVIFEQMDEGEVVAPG